METSSCLKKLGEEKGTCAMASMFVNKLWDVKIHKSEEYQRAINDYTNVLNLLLTHVQVSECKHKDRRREYIQKVLDENKKLVSEHDRSKWITHHFINNMAVRDLTFGAITLYALLEKPENRKNEIDKIKTEIGRTLNISIEAERKNSGINVNSDDAYTQSKIGFGFLDSIEDDPLLLEINEKNCEILYPSHFSGFLKLLDRRIMIAERLRRPISKEGTSSLSLSKIMYHCVYTEDDFRKIDSYIERLGYRGPGNQGLSYRI